MYKFFIVNEDFESIINNTLAQKSIFSKPEIEFISTGWTNIVYKVKTPERNFYFRFPRDSFWERTIVKDYEFTKFIRGKTSFKTVELELHRDKNRAFSVHEEIAGTPLAEKMNTMNEEEIGKVSAQMAKFMNELHSINATREKVFTIDNIDTNLNGFVQELLDVHVADEDKKFWKNNNLVYREERVKNIRESKSKNKNNVCAASEVIEQNNDAAYSIKAKSKQSKTIVHGDLNSSNILLDEENNVAAIIDFGFAGFGNKYNDIARIVGRCPEKFKKPIVENYEKIASQRLDEDELNREILVWNNIDNAYINYMKSEGIYKE